ncbi:uncharacterized protein Hap1MRO34_005517 [Clarias gariepinus]
MTRFGLWAAALSLVCLIAVVTSQTAIPTETPSDDDGTVGATCTQYFNVDFTMTGPRVMDMLFARYLDYFQNLGTEQVKGYLATYDTNRDRLLNLGECENLVNHIIQNAPNN